MKIDCWYPNPDEVMHCEFETLRFIRDNFYQYQPELEKFANDANTYYHRFYKFKNLNEFKFESELNIKVDGKDGIAHIGSLVNRKDENNINRTTHYVAICKEGEKKLLRKFHFDYDPLNQNSKSHPLFHLQYAGKLTPRLKEKGIEDNQLESWLSEPRLFYFPLSLALLINLIWKEFPSLKTSKLSETSEWRCLVKRNEELIIAPFFSGCNSFFQKESGQLFTTDFCYGN